MIIDSKNDFFTVNLLFCSLRNGVSDFENIWEESIVLIEAFSAEDALEKAAKLGKERSVSYQVEDGDKLDWVFFRAVQAFQIDMQKLGDGAELFSRHLRGAEVESLLRSFDD